MKVFVTLLTGIQGQREGVYEVNRDFLKRLRRPGVAMIMARMSTEVQWLVVGSMLVLAANFLGMSVG